MRAVLLRRYFVLFSFFYLNISISVLDQYWIENKIFFLYEWSGMLPSPVNAEDHEHVGGGDEPPRPGHHQHFADEVPCVPLAKKSYSKTFSKTQIAEKSLTKVKV